MTAQLDLQLFPASIIEPADTDLRSRFKESAIFKLAKEAAELTQWSDDAAVETVMREKTAALAYCYAAGARTVGEACTMLTTKPLLLTCWGEHPVSARVRLFQAHHEAPLSAALAHIYQHAWLLHHGPGRASVRGLALPMAQISASLAALARLVVRHAFS
jgi:hypothetical protein